MNKFKLNKGDAKFLKDHLDTFKNEAVKSSATNLIRGGWISVGFSRTPPPINRLK